MAITRFQSARRQAGLVGWAAAAFVFVVGFTEAELRETDGPPAKPSLVLSSDARRGSLTTTQALQHQVPFSVVVAEHDGVLEFKYGSNQEPERLIAQKAVVLTTPETTISCAVLTYDYKTRELDAQGPELQVEQRARGEVGEVRYVADAMHWNTESGEWRLEGSPVVYQKQRNGTVAVTRGDQIRVFERNGMRQFRVSGPQNILKTTRSGPDAAEE